MKKISAETSKVVELHFLFSKNMFSLVSSIILLLLGRSYQNHSDRKLFLGLPTFCCITFFWQNKNSQLFSWYKSHLLISDSCVGYSMRENRKGRIAHNQRSLFCLRKTTGFFPEIPLHIQVVLMELPRPKCTQLSPKRPSRSLLAIKDHVPPIKKPYVKI